MEKLTPYEWNKIKTIMLWIGCTMEDAKNSWAFRNFEEAKKIYSLKQKIIGKLRDTL